MKLSRRRFLLGASATAAAAVVAANMPAALIQPGAYIAELPAWCPKGYLPCDGRVVLRSEYAQLFALMGTSHGSDGPLTFNLPELPPRHVIAAKTTMGDIAGTVRQVTYWK